MRASDCTFEELRLDSASCPDLGKTLSFIQVEYGLKDLKALWQGFMDFSDDSGTEYESKKELYQSFREQLEDHVELQSLLN